MPERTQEERDAFAAGALNTCDALRAGLHTLQGGGERTVDIDWVLLVIDGLESRAVRVADPSSDV